MRGSTAFFRRLLSVLARSRGAGQAWLDGASRGGSIPDRSRFGGLFGRPGLREMAGLAAVVAAGIAWRVVAGGGAASARGPEIARPARAPAAEPAEKTAGRPALAALVNGTAIGWEQLSAETLARHGAVTLEAIVNKRIIEQACRRESIVVTEADVSAEIDAMAGRFGVPRDRWLDLIRDERGVTEEQYSSEIVWPMIALSRLARGSAAPDDEEVRKAFESRFGPAVKARILVARTRADAERLRQAAVAAPDDFGAIARRESVDVTSASANGWVQPIRRHSGDESFEAAAFALEPGQISPVVQVADQFIVLKCEGRLPAAEIPLDQVRDSLVAEISEQQSREASAAVFRRLQETATVVNVFNDPAASRAAPGVAATVNGEPIPLALLQEACLDRHGREVLEILITRSLIGQALSRQRLEVTQADIDAEIGRAAAALGFQKADGTPDVQSWLGRMTQESRVSAAHYVDDIVRPTVALKKLVGGVSITRDDLDKAFEATFGARARCRMIVLDTQRRAQEVWQLARDNPTPEFIGELAERYSADPTSRSLRGEVPPIQRHGGQPALEREVFSLAPGELSGIVQVADRFLIIYCEGFTAPVDVKLEEVQAELREDLHEKKQRIELARYFTHLREGAAIDNFLAGTSQTPLQQGVPPTAARSPASAATITREEAEELARPRVGSRTAGLPGGVVPASREVPSTRQP
jgi:parvulin-like peptidyl-prolyl isomerase